MLIPSITASSRVCFCLLFNSNFHRHLILYRLLRTVLVLLFLNSSFPSTSMGRFFLQPDDASLNDDDDDDDADDADEEEEDSADGDEDMSMDVDENDYYYSTSRYRGIAAYSSLSSVCSSSSKLLGRAMATRFRPLLSSPLEEGEIREEQEMMIPEDIDVIPEEEEEGDENNYEYFRRYKYDESSSSSASPSPQQQQRQRQLTRYNRDDSQLQHYQHQHQQQQQQPAAPIHYHIYYTPPLPPHEERSSSTYHIHHLLAWKLVAIVAVLSHILYWYKDGMMNMNMNMMNMNSNSMSYGNVLWQKSWGGVIVNDWRFWNSIMMIPGGDDDDDDVKNSDIPARDSDDDACAWTSSFGNGKSTDDAGLALFGQDFVLEELHKALVSRRQQYQSTSSISTISGRRPRPRPLPLMLYATGGPGVGKRYLAQLLAQQCNNDALLELDMRSSDMIDHDHDDDDDDSMMIQSIIRKHVLSHYPHGSLLLLSHLDSNSSNAAQQTRVLEALHDLILQDKEEEEEDAFSSSSSSSSSLPHDLWKNVIVVYTSSFGATAIDKTIRRYYSSSSSSSSSSISTVTSTPGEEAIPESSRSSLLPMKELQSYLHQQWMDQQQEQQQQQRQKQAAVGSSSSLQQQQQQDELQRSVIVLPFLPLGRTAIQSMIPHQLFSQQAATVFGLIGSTIHISKRTSSLLLDHLLPMLEWQTWIHKPTGKELYTFLPNGGHDVHALLEEQMFLFPSSPAPEAASSCSLPTTTAADATTTNTLWLDWADHDHFADADADADAGSGSQEEWSWRILSCPSSASSSSTTSASSSSSILMIDEEEQVEQQQQQQLWDKCQLLCQQYPVPTPSSSTAATN